MSIVSKLMINSWCNMQSHDMHVENYERFGGYNVHNSPILILLEDDGDGDDDDDDGGYDYAPAAYEDDGDDDDDDDDDGGYDYAPAA